MEIKFPNGSTIKVIDKDKHDKIRGLDMDYCRDDRCKYCGLETMNTVCNDCKGFESE